MVSAACVRTEHNTVTTYLTTIIFYTGLKLQGLITGVKISASAHGMPLSSSGIYLNFIILRFRQTSSQQGHTESNG